MVWIEKFFAIYLVISPDVKELALYRAWCDENGDENGALKRWSLQMKVQLTLRWNFILRWPFAMVRWKWNVSKLRWFFLVYNERLRDLFKLRWKAMKGCVIFSSCNGIMRWFLIYDGNQWPSQLKAMTSLSIVIIGPSLHRKLLQIVPMEMVRLRWCDDFEILRLR